MLILTHLNVITSSSFLAGLASLVISIETLVNRKLFESGNILDWRTTRLSAPNWALPIFDLLFEYSWSNNLVTELKAIVSLLLIYQACCSQVSVWTLGLLFSLHQFTNSRMPIGRDGAIQMTSIVLFGLILITWPHNSYLNHLGLLFIATQITLAYTASGWAKWVSPIWRNENVLASISNTKSFGKPWVAQFFYRHPTFARLSSLAVMIWQASFPIVIFSSTKVLVLYLVIGFCFHLSIAIAMGLNTFLYSFTACYPILIIAITELHRVAPWLQVINWK
ncbi:hypothetical protein [Parashewanella tropica]|uniref:hypothetical protein n=1 Tax=Parashewanella tropica TaxID=2547970 RepID=UPI001478FD12|nr:hypothetical protein [Parashewanella tropica]